MIKWLKKRKNEPSTYAGLGMLIYGAGTLFKSRELEPVGQALTHSADALAAGDYVTPISLILGGLLATLKAEKRD